MQEQRAKDVIGAGLGMFDDTPKGAAGTMHFTTQRTDRERIPAQIRVTGLLARSATTLRAPTRGRSCPFVEAIALTRIPWITSQGIGLVPISQRPRERNVHHRRRTESTPFGPEDRKRFAYLPSIAESMSWMRSFVLSPSAMIAL